MRSREAFEGAVEDDEPVRGDLLGADAGPEPHLVEESVDRTPHRRILLAAGQSHKDSLERLAAVAEDVPHERLESRQILDPPPTLPVEVDPDDPLSHKRLVEEEAVRIVRRRGDLIITETTHGFVCANSGVDLSNVEHGRAALLPKDSDRSARRIRDIVRARLGVDVGVIVSDTFGRAWRKGLTDVAIGVAGIAAVVDLRGTPDALGRTMQVTEVAVADELASAAELVMGKASGIPVAVVRGADTAWFRESSVRELIRPPQEDLFR